MWFSKRYALVQILVLFRCSVYLHLSSGLDVGSEVPSALQLFYRQSSCFNLPPQAFNFASLQQLLPLPIYSGQLFAFAWKCFGEARCSVVVLQSYLRLSPYHSSQLPAPYLSLFVSIFAMV